MITCVIGTRAQLVKMAPVIKELEVQKVDFQILLTGQHKETMDTLFRDFSINTTPIQLENPNEVSSVLKMFFWFPRALIKLYLRRKKLFKCNENKNSWILVHGDTLSTLIGSFVGKFTSCQVAHVESGLRSNSFFSPFPEEITRVLTFHLSDVGFCPGQWAVENLKKYKIKAIDTKANTIIDSVNVALKNKNNNAKVPAKKYVVVSIHRFENIYKKKRFKIILDIVHQISDDYLMLFVLHPATKKRLIKYDLMEKLISNDNIKLRNRMGYIPFVKLLSGAAFVVTDGGSNQEELAYLNIPSLLMRDATERPEGIGKTAVLNGFKQSVVDEFLNNVKMHKVDIESEMRHSPSKLIVEYLIQNKNEKNN